MPSVLLFVNDRGDFLLVSTLAELDFALQALDKAWIVFLIDLLACHCIE